MTTRTHRRINRGALAVLAVAVTALIVVPAAESDDRDLFRTAASKPYVMVLFDTTGSMADNLRGRDTALEDDDTTSKLYLAKQALDAVLQGVDGVNFGFATFPNQNGHWVNYKSGSNRYVVDSGGSGTSQNCSGWEGNGDSRADRYDGYTYKFPTVTNPRGLSVGDLVPLDWGNDNVREIRERLAPNLALGEVVPDFGIARYFRDRDQRRANYRKLRSEAARPFIARGLTPLASTLQTFGKWYQSWANLAEAGDKAFAAGCKQTFVILLTDGFETCGGTPDRKSAPTVAGELLANGIRTFVVGFAVNNNALNNIAVAGGTDASPNPDGSVNPGDPENEAFFAADQDELVEQLGTILREIQRTARSFATAAVPSVVGTAAENAYLTSFSPVDEGGSLWPGRIDGWVKPIPTVSVSGAGGARQVPDRTVRCGGPDDDSCRAWDAGEEILDQAPTPSEAAGGTYKVGDGTGERRVYYGRVREDEEIPARREFFLPPTDAEAEDELFGPYGFGFTLPLDGSGNVDTGHADYPADHAAAVNNGTKVIADTLAIKTALIEKPAPEVGEELKSFVIGDIFHSDPAILTEPQRVRYFSADLGGALEACGVSNTDVKRYPCFVKQHTFRRRVLFVGSNEGALHAIDAGVPVEDPTTGLVDYTRGSGKEIFAFVPRSVFGDVREMSQGLGQTFTVDGPVVMDDFLMDPISDVSDPPNPDEREWRSVVIGGLREGGAAYYALDVTQPDTYDPDSRVSNASDHRPQCGDGGSGCGPLPYPSVVWEFTDVWDEDDNAAPDLGDAWSKVNTGRIRVLDGADIVDKYVAIFGGGMDAAFKDRPFDDSGNLRPYSGNFLYMVDIETGKTIYKRRLDLIRGSAPTSDVELDDVPGGAFVVPSSVPSEPAAVDTDFDSYIDTVYIGTTGGYVFKVDLSVPEELETVTVRDYAVDLDPGAGFTPESHIVERIVAPGWEPFAIYDTRCASGAPCVRPVYYPPSVIFVNELSQFALAVGVGDREDINLKDQPTSQFTVFVDRAFTPATSDLPLDESDFAQYDRATAGVGTCVNEVLFSPPPGKQKGWVLAMDEDERLLNRPFSLAGLVTFTTFIPETLVTSGGACGADGISRLYGLRLPCANSLGDDVVLEEVNDFVTQPFVDTGKVSETSEDPDDISDREKELTALTDSLKAQFPEECTFTNFTLDLKVLLSRTGVETLVPIPVCVIERNWKEF